ncbi:hypothetical protein GCM10011571_27330 [Marinithermofilum abyssi]|uniref:Copper resistance protein D domain-containing protein n=1 Tax=Marinithermofilum abyssi TaxID=1571185 RepID=A0A8J2VJI1_9BACL|nr:hypothetical protein [Marinithermofilum abyssi]GGE23816.1 hypothetical protein GCM10011571_27330 [Marinithermofilum abyssi]
MAYKIALFIHVFSMATWFGGIAGMAFLLRKSIRQHEQGFSMKQTLENVHKLNTSMIVPTAVLVLAAGLYMLTTWDANKPLWLLVKERFGSLITFLYIVAIPFYGKKLLNKVREATDAAEMAAGVKRYIMLLNVTLLAMLVIIFFVTFQIS